ncbi:hypothetical protein NECAME_11485 [Necator americanus]|uniref:Uncharacterized protein n=1 Tax=Necator americanus TaxID=51031 RepID=W2T3Z3_NECAM|nr:hypothetical protein NECAME_11485 [Necator americanus]ETN76740.1 hypothetical protein NECAME_11485 [Necator americanus]
MRNKQWKDTMICSLLLNSQCDSQYTPTG